MAEEDLAALSLALTAPPREAAAEPPRERRDCPSCRKRVMAAATRCGYCWSKLTPVAAAPALAAPL